MLEASHEIKWSDHYSKLETYHARNGHCNVPQKCPAVSVLGRWVTRQRKALKDGTLKPSQVARLDAIGFLFNNTELLTSSK